MDKTYTKRADAQKLIAVTCTQTSAYVKKYFIDSDFKGCVLDLGSGIGANALPLAAKNCPVIVIDKQKEAIEKLLKISDRAGLQIDRAIIGDITEESYPENMDAVVCVDTLPYIHPSKLKATMNKIHKALRPNGLFIGTIFFKLKKNDNLFIKNMIEIGVNFYPNQDFVRKIINLSGFKIKNETIYEDETISGLYIFEFLAKKPVQSNEKNSNSHEESL